MAHKRLCASGTIFTLLVSFFVMVNVSHADSIMNEGVIRMGLKLDYFWYTQLYLHPGPTRNNPDINFSRDLDVEIMFAGYNSPEPNPDSFYVDGALILSVSGFDIDPHLTGFNPMPSTQIDTSYYAAYQNQLVFNTKSETYPGASQGVYKDERGLGVWFLFNTTPVDMLSLYTALVSTWQHGIASTSYDYRHHWNDTYQGGMLIYDPETHFDYYSISTSITSISYDHAHPPTALPEPGTMLLMGVGALGVAFMRRSKASKAA